MALTTITKIRIKDTDKTDGDNNTKDNSKVAWRAGGCGRGYWCAGGLSSGWAWDNLVPFYWGSTVYSFAQCSSHRFGVSWGWWWNKSCSYGGSITFCCKDSNLLSTNIRSVYCFACIGLSFEPVEKILHELNEVVDIGLDNNIENDSVIRDASRSFESKSRCTRSASSGSTWASQTSGVTNLTVSSLSIVRSYQVESIIAFSTRSFSNTICTISCALNASSILEVISCVTSRTCL